MAREVVKEAGYKFSKGRSRSQLNYKLFDDPNGESLPDGNDNNDSIDIETFKDEEYESDTSNSDVKSDHHPNYRKNFARLEEKLLSGVNGLNGRKNCVFKEETNSSRSSSQSFQEKRRQSDQLEAIGKQIEMNNLQIEELRSQPKSKETNEVLSKLIKLEDELKKLIEEKNNLLKIQKLDR